MSSLPSHTTRRSIIFLLSCAVVLPVLALAVFSLFAMRNQRQNMERERERRADILADGILDQINRTFQQMESGAEDVSRLSSTAFRRHSLVAVITKSGSNAESKSMNISDGGQATNEIGTVLNCTPTVGPDGYTIDLTIIWQSNTLLGTNPPFIANMALTQALSIWDGHTGLWFGLTLTAGFFRTLFGLIDRLAGRINQCGGNNHIVGIRRGGLLCQLVRPLILHWQDYGLAIPDRQCLR